MLRDPLPITDTARAKAKRGGRGENAVHAGGVSHYEAVIQAMTQTHEQAVVAWQSERESFIQQQITQNVAIDSQKEQYLKGVPDAITAYCDLVLSRSEYVDCFPKEYELDYNPESKVLIVDYALPAPDDLPTLTEV